MLKHGVLVKNLDIIITIIALLIIIISFRGRNKEEIILRSRVTMPIDKKDSRLLSYIVIIIALIFLLYVWVS